MSHDETQPYRPNEPTGADDREARLDRAIAAFLKEADAGTSPQPEDWIARHPDLEEGLREFFADRANLEQLAAPMREAIGPAVGSKVRYVGDYEILDELGRGGMGVVYQARQVSLKRVVALKMILGGAHAGADDLVRFRSEAEAAARLQHPNIVQIHEIGQHEGRPYAALEFVEGGSLAERLAGVPMPVRQAAQLVERLARAVHAANERGIVHRDLKPSNVLLAPSDRAHAVELGVAASPVDRTATRFEPKITDFGLAKLMKEDSGYTRTGAVIGTPSYMAPEQAAGKNREIGPAVDIYALGAILYELLTGRPPFQAETPQETIRQVLDTEPAPPRLLNANVPRDLETICLKCLRKNAADRYDTAADLADDVERFLAGESIVARPVSPVEKAARWIWKRRVPAALVAGTAAAVALLIFGVVRGREAYRESQLANIRFKTEGQALTAEVLYLDREELVVPRFTIPTQEPQRLPDGEFRLRISAPRQVSEEYQFLVERGNSRNWEVALSDRALWPGIPIGHESIVEQYELIDLAGAPDFIIYSQQGIRRVRGMTGEQVWAAVEALPESFHRLSLEQLLPGYYEEWPPHFLRPAPDLDGDGVGDVVVGSSERPAILSYSGATGELLWVWAASPEIQQFTGDIKGLESLDVNDDGIPDVLAVVDAFGPQEDGSRVSVIEAAAISGVDGATIWRKRFGWRTKEPGVVLPVQSMLATSGDDAVFLFQYDGKMRRLDARTGEPVSDAAAVADYEIEPSGGLRVLPHALADLDGDGRMDAVVRKSGPNVPSPVVEAVSLESGEQLFRTKLTATADLTSNEWPSFVDLADDRIPELLRLYESSDGRKYVQAIEIRTGDVLWERVLALDYFQWNPDAINLQLIAGPDLDGDGWRELFMATVAMETHTNPETHHLFVDALSGNDGELLWTFGRKMPGTNRDVSVGRLAWAWPGRDGWPTLAVPHRYAYSSVFPAEVFLLEVGKGELHDILTGVRDVEAADFNGDGLPDLYWNESLVENNPTWGGELRGVRGELPAWRRLEQWQPAADVNGDGITDLINGGGGAPTATCAVSGADGTILWSSKVEGGRFLSQPAPLGDLNGDGVADVLAMRQAFGNRPSPLVALSGKDGATLWTAAEPRATDEVDIRLGPLLEIADLDGDGSGEVVAILEDDFSMSGGDRNQLTVFAGGTGELKWRRPVDLTQWRDVRASYCDLNGDGVQDIVLPIEKDGATLLAVDGKSGGTLWQWNTPDGRWYSYDPGDQDSPVSSIDAYTSDGKPGLIVNAGGKILALDALGQEIWTWNQQRQFRSDVFLSTPRQTIETEVRRQADGQPHVYIYYTADVDRRGQERQSETHVIEVDKKGETVREAYLPPGATLMCRDLDGDDATCVLTDDELLVFDGDLDQPPIWKWSRPTGKATIVDVRTAEADQPATVIVAVDQQAFGIAQGDVQWRVEVRDTFTGRLGRRMREEFPKMLAATGNCLPSFAARYLDGSWHPRQGVVVRQAAATNADGAYPPPVGTARSYNMPVHDIRQFQPLPWADSIEPASWLGLASLALAAVANFLVFRWGRRPPLSGVMLVIMTLVALALVGGFSPAFVPVVVFWFLLIRYTVQRRKWAAALLAVSALAISGVAAGISMWFVSQQMLPGQTYDWTGWWAVFYFGAYTAGLLALPVLFIRWLVRRAATRRRRYDEFRQRVKRSQHDEPIGSAQ